jgi:hypothetical protein
VDVWPPPPPVLVPIYEMTEWHGPKWLVVYEGTADRRGLRLVHLVYGEPGTNIALAGIITFAKQPAEELGKGVRAPATDLSFVADYTLLRLLDRLPHPASTGESRRAWERNQLEAVRWASSHVEVNGIRLQGQAATVDAATAICVDAGEVFIGMYIVRSVPAGLPLRPLADLSGYPMPSEADHPRGAA